MKSLASDPTLSYVGTLDQCVDLAETVAETVSLGRHVFLPAQGGQDHIHL